MKTNPETSAPSPRTEEIVLRDEERQRCEVWTRVMGYHRPVAEFNVGKKSEHRTRRHFVAQAVIAGLEN
jgi:hypothetical protein